MSLQCGVCMRALEDGWESGRYPDDSICAGCWQEVSVDTRAILVLGQQLLGTLERLIDSIEESR